LSDKNEKRKRGRKPKYEAKVCPSCGQIYRSTVTREVNGRRYVYAVHRYKDWNGKWRKFECYLGPEEEYKHAQIFNPLGLKGAKYEDRFIDYLSGILNYYKITNQIDTEKTLEILNEVMELLTKIAVSEADKKKIVEVLQGWIERLQKQV